MLDLLEVICWELQADTELLIPVLFQRAPLGGVTWGPPAQGGGEDLHGLTLYFGLTPHAGLHLHLASRCRRAKEHVEMHLGEIG